MSSSVTEKAALDYHRYPRPGKIEVVPTKPYSTQSDLALAYSPGVAYPCKAIEAEPAKVFDYTDKGNLVAVISNGTAVLGLGDIGPLAGKPVMEGKALLFKIFAGLDCFDIEVNEKDPERFIQVVKAISPTFGGINLEDIKAPECFEIERRLREECDIPVMHDDQHGTAIISAAGLLNALFLQKKEIGDVRLVVNGAGAAAVACTNLYISLGIKRENVVMCDSRGPITTSRSNLSPQKAQFATSRPLTSLAEAMVDADVFLGLSVKDVVTEDMIRSMAPRPIVFALANPDPEISYDLAMEARPDLIFATGRSDYPNQINNVLGFPYIFRGALDCGATEINETMKLYAVRAIADLARKPVPTVVNTAYNTDDLAFGPNYILPKPLDPRLLTVVAPAVARGAIDSGVARRPITDWEDYDKKLRHLMGYDNKLMRHLSEEAKRCPRRVVFGEANTDNTLRAATLAGKQGTLIPVLLGNEEMIAKRAKRLGIDLTGVEIVNPRHDREAERRKMFSEKLAEKLQRAGLTRREADELMYDRNYFGMMMVETGQADAFIGGAYSAAQPLGEIARQVIGIRDGFRNFATLHILETRKGTFFLADSQVNRRPDEDALVDIARLTAHAVEFFSHDPVMAMVSYSNFGSGAEDPECRAMARAVERLHRENPEICIDGEMQVDYALNKGMRDKAFPFNHLRDKDVNALIFPNLSAASTAYHLMLEMGVADAIGPIQMGLKKPVHFISVDASVREIIALATLASVDAAFNRMRC